MRTTPPCDGSVGMRDARVRYFVWDRFVRVFHWSLALAVGATYLVLEGGEKPHEWVGYVAAALVVARVIWGFVGSTHARFANFIPTPDRVSEHLEAMRRREPSIGHNPLGAVMMVTLMGLVLLLGITGYLQGIDAFFGDETMMDLHEWLAHALIACVAMHVTAAVVMSFWDRTNLVAAMITGHKIFDETPEPHGSSRAREHVS